MKIALISAIAATAVVAVSTYAKVGSGSHNTTLEVQAIPFQTCFDGQLSSSGCKLQGVQIARGAECPAASGAYCSDEFPYCCGTPGNYYCAKDVNSC